MGTGEGRRSCPPCAVLVWLRAGGRRCSLHRGEGIAVGAAQGFLSLGAQPVLDASLPSVSLDFLMARSSGAP